MRKFRFLLGLCALLVLGVGGSTAFAQATQGLWCSGGAIAPGSYDYLVVSGTCTINGAVTVNGNVLVQEGAYLDAAYKGTHLTVKGNVAVTKGATLGLGCSFGYHDCGLDPTAWVGNVVVNGNILANQALTMYIDFTTIHGNVASYGGGNVALVDHPPADDGLVFPIKDNVIDGSVTVDGWKGAWFGIIRSTIGGNVVVANTVGTRLGDDDTPDSTEIVTNTIAGDLVCFGNNPVAQIGDSGGHPNTVGGARQGECAGL